MILDVHLEFCFFLFCLQIFSSFHRWFYWMPRNLCWRRLEDIVGWYILWACMDILLSQVNLCYKTSSTFFVEVRFSWNTWINEQCYIAKKSPKASVNASQPTHHFHCPKFWCRRMVQIYLGYIGLELTCLSTFCEIGFYSFNQGAWAI